MVYQVFISSFVNMSHWIGPLRLWKRNAKINCWKIPRRILRTSNTISRPFKNPYQRFLWTRTKHVKVWWYWQQEFKLGFENRERRIQRGNLDSTFISRLKEYNYTQMNDHIGEAILISSTIQRTSTIILNYCIFMKRINAVNEYFRAYWIILEAL
jgi:hypothetical protein